MKFTFQDKSGVISNPYIGFTSFQHFNGEKLYSDRIVVPVNGIASTETEDYECYPVPDGVKENGRAEGFHPECTVAYIRILWKEFEPEQGVYNYAFIQDILDKAKAHGQTVMFRLMAHSTCERDDVPDWLKKIVVCPARPDGKRVKDSPTDERFLNLYEQAVLKLGEKFDKDPTLDAVDVCLPGSWGEGYNLEAYSDEALKRMMDTFVTAFPNTKLIGQVASPEMINHIGKTRPIGFRGDGTGSPKHIHIIFPDSFSKLEKEVWKTAPVSFEAYWWISEWLRQGWDIDEIIDLTLGWHVSTFNNKSFPIQPELKEKIDRWLMKMGYRFAIRSTEIETEKDTLFLALTVENQGVAPIYNKLPLKIKLVGKTEKEFATDTDIRAWLPGFVTENYKFDVGELENGKYDVYAKIGGGEYPTVNFATVTENQDGYFKIGEVEL